jgi:GMP synthase-like glutamine amidotransferase
MKIIALQHVDFEGTGLIDEWAATRGHSISLHQCFGTAPFPTTADMDMLVIMGGPMSIHDEQEYPWLIHEKALIKHAIEQGKYVVGVCLGAQLIANVLGAKVYKNSVREIGWFPVALSDDALGTPYISGLNSAMTVLHWHGETFDLPERAVHLMSSAACHNQAFSYNAHVLALQFHLEMTEAGLRSIIDGCRDELVPSGTVQTEEELLRGIHHIAACQRTLFRMLDGLVAEQSVKRMVK